MLSILHVATSLMRIFIRNAIPKLRLLPWLTMEEKTYLIANESRLNNSFETTDQVEKQKISKSRDEKTHQEISIKQKNNETIDAENDNLQAKVLNYGNKMKSSKRNENRTGQSGKVDHFFSLRITNPLIHDRVRKIHQEIQKKNKIIENTFVPVPTLHLTLFVMSLKNDVQKQKAINAMSLSTNGISEIIQKLSNKLVLKFERLNSFGGRVVFIDLIDDENLASLRSIIKIIKNSFRELNVGFKNESFTAHLTVMKMSKCMEIMRRKKINRIPAYLYKKYKEESFGSDTFTEIQLCSMVDPKEDDGFYKTIAKINLNGPVTVELSSGQEHIYNVKNFSLSDDFKVLKEEFLNEAKSLEDGTDNDISQAGSQLNPNEKE